MRTLPVHDCIATGGASDRCYSEPSDRQQRILMKHVVTINIDEQCVSLDGSKVEASSLVGNRGSQKNSANQPTETPNLDRNFRNIAYVAAFVRQCLLNNTLWQFTGGCAIKTVLLLQICVFGSPKATLRVGSDITCCPRLDRRSETLTDQNLRRCYCRRNIIFHSCVSLLSRICFPSIRHP